MQLNDKPVVNAKFKDDDRFNPFESPSPAKKGIFPFPMKPHAELQ